MLNLDNEMSGFSDAQVIALVNRENTDAFIELAARYMSLIRAKAAALRTGSLLEPEDLYQEGLMGLLSAAHSYRESGSASFRTYAGICIYNQMVTACRSAASRKNLPLHNFVSLQDAEQNQSVEAAFVSDQAANPETLLIDRESLEGLKARIHQTLSKMEQEVLFLYLNNCTYHEIADRLSLPAKSVDNAIQRVRRKLKEPF